MFRLLRITFLGIILLLSFRDIFASTFPFTDISSTDPAYSAVKNLFDQGIITDDGSHLFRPRDPIDRDAFVGLSVSVSCRKCITPTPADIIAYQISPFMDLVKTNPYYYCIAYANNTKIVQGYTPDATGKAYCQDGSSFTTSPFCAQNKTSRIESAAMLLRQANLWNDTMNTGFKKTIEITDVSTYWQGYAEKGISAGILSLTGNKISPDEYITRAEYAIMASKIVSYNQCVTDASTSTLPSEIRVRDASGKEIQKNVFGFGSLESLGVIGGYMRGANGGMNENGDTSLLDKKWAMTNPVTKEVVSGTGDTFAIGKIGCGNWIAGVDLIDRTSGKVVSSSSSTITIECAAEKATPPLSVLISTRPLETYIGKAIDFGALISGGAGGVSATWDYGDGTQNHTVGDTTHTYSEPGAYTVTITVTDKDGHTSQSSLVIVITGDSDTDGDGLIDRLDACPQVKGSLRKSGCPDLTDKKYGDLISDKLQGNAISASDIQNTVGADITLRDSAGGIKNISSLLVSDAYFFTPEIVAPVGSTYTYNWKATDAVTGKVVNYSGEKFPTQMLGKGDWNIELSVVDQSGKVVSTPTSRVSIVESPTLSVDIDASKLSIAIGESVNISVYITSSLGNTTQLQSTWDFGDGKTSQTQDTVLSHSYNTPGFYTVQVSVMGASGKSVTSTLVIKVGDGWSTNTSPVSTFISGLTTNICLAEKSRTNGLIIARPICTKCPCENQMEITTLVRSCDILFPTILSLDTKEVYSRGGLFVVP